MRTPARWTITAVLAAALGSVAACGGNKDSPGSDKRPPAGSASPAGSGSGEASGSAAQPATGRLGLYVDDAQVGTVELSQLAAWPRLDTLVPETARRLGKWEAIYLKGAKPTPTELMKPFETYRDYIPALFPNENGTISFGMFDPVELGKKGKPAVREDGITEVRIKLASNSGRGENDHGGGSAADPASIELQVKTAAGTQTLTGVKLLAIPRETMPGGDAKGWKLVTVLDAAGIKKWSKLLLRDAAGLTLTIESSEVDAKTIPFIKLNRQGALRFRMLKQQGDGWQASGDLRSLNYIEILK